MRRLRRLIKKIIEKIRPTPPKPEPEFPEGMIWLDANISGWPVTAKLNAYISGVDLVLSNTKQNLWPDGPDARGGGAVNANAWVIVKRDGKWYAATWEYLRTGQHWKRAAWLKAGDGHIPHRVMDGWVPQKGERIGHMVSTLARGPYRTIDERSNVDWMVWE
jgi:hypothetical protein